MTLKTSTIRNQPTRRNLLAAACASVVVGFSASGANASGDLPKVTEDDPAAAALGYKEDATTVDVEKWPQRAGEDNANNFCSNCALYTGKADVEHGPCSIFPGKEVAAAGWCSAFAPKPA